MYCFADRTLPVKCLEFLHTGLTCLNANQKESAGWQPNTPCCQCATQGAKPGHLQRLGPKRFAVSG